MAVTIHDVAREAGVSVSTVSRALSGARRVGPEVAERVHEAARLVGYRHNAVARALRAQRTGVIGMIVPEISNPFFPAIVEAVERTLQESDRELMLCDARLSADVERRRIHALLGRQVDGLLISPVDSQASAEGLREAMRHTPVVQLDRYADQVRLDWVGVDDEAGMAHVVNHVRELGAQRIVLVSAGQQSSSGRDRLDALRRATASAGITECVELLGEFSIEWGESAARQLLAGGELPDALVCGNDEIAVGAIRELRRHGVAIPEQVMITGFDDIFIASYVEPALTTLRQPREAIATEAVRLLDARLADTDLPVRKLALEPELVVRESTVSSAEPE
ncbi:substrate-binding domain-containing protein [Phytoactinopolyspora mesophila]|uniref:Substrate-binding domain-containing protein n=1 Tax=Phytoactinopolyspora mesophila TaxID=2650750 RepID=A0A7K3M745_9ACTN|nr:substrate-binding domain-containing protein [Phytoactinopolyspora mesophila]